MESESYSVLSTFEDSQLTQTPKPEVGFIQEVDFKTAYDSEDNVRQAITAFLDTKPFDFNEKKEIAVSDLANAFTDWAKTTAWSPSEDGYQWQGVGE